MAAVPDDTDTAPCPIAVGDRYLWGHSPARVWRLVEMYESGGTTYCRLECEDRDHNVVSMPRADVRERLRGSRSFRRLSR
jgi:hypothetical protein